MSQIKINLDKVYSLCLGGVSDSVPKAVDYLLECEKFTQWTYMADRCTSIPLWHGHALNSPQFNVLPRVFLHHMLITEPNEHSGTL